MIEFLELAKVCAPEVHPITMVAVIRHESGFDPLAINVNGKPGYQIRPKTRAEAVERVRKLLAEGASFDAGYGQINNANWQRLGITPENVFDPCTNLRAAQAVLVECYQRASQQREGPAALYAALSCYNTGNFTYGFRNGYVDKVLAGASARNTHQVPPIPDGSLPTAKQPTTKAPAHGSASRLSESIATNSRPDAFAQRRQDAFAQPRPDAFGDYPTSKYTQRVFGPPVGSIVYHNGLAR